MVEALEIIEQLSWRVAKTMPEIPHQYTVRQPDERLQALYFQLYEIIQRDGVIERWRGQKRRYLHPGDGYKYWAMTTHKWSSRILNRMLIADDTPEMRARVGA